MHFYLIGYRGSGKSTVGRLLSQQLSLPSIDTDPLVEQAAGKSIRDIFSQDGESVFRDWEQRVVSKVAARAETQPAVVSLGGGAVLRPANQALLSKTGRCIWLTGSPQSLYQRINQDESSQATRPQLTDSDGYTEVKEILAMREPIYRSLADLTVNTDDQSPDELMVEILLWAKSVA